MALKFTVLLWNLDYAKLRHSKLKMKRKEGLERTKIDYLKKYQFINKYWHNLQTSETISLIKQNKKKFKKNKGFIKKLSFQEKVQKILNKIKIKTSTFTSRNQDINSSKEEKEVQFNKVLLQNHYSTKTVPLLFTAS